MHEARTAFAIKTEIADLDATAFTFVTQKTMYGGKKIRTGDKIFLFASENEGGPGLFARGVITGNEGVPKRGGVTRQTPRVSIAVERTATAKKRLGRTELRAFSAWKDGQPETELNFKLYRQATNKIVGLTDATARFLDRLF
jgi:hypothetical protein